MSGGGRKKRKQRMQVADDRHTTRALIFFSACCAVPGTRKRNSQAPSFSRPDPENDGFGRVARGRVRACMLSAVLHLPRVVGQFESRLK